MNDGIIMLALSLSEGCPHFHCVGAEVYSVKMRLYCLLGFCIARMGHLG